MLEERSTLLVVEKEQLAEKNAALPEACDDALMNGVDAIPTLITASRKLLERFIEAI